MSCCSSGWCWLGKVSICGRIDFCRKLYSFVATVRARWVNRILCHPVDVLLHPLHHALEIVVRGGLPYPMVFWTAVLAEVDEVQPPFLEVPNRVEEFVQKLLRSFRHRLILLLVVVCCPREVLREPLPLIGNGSELLCIRWDPEHWPRQLAALFPHFCARVEVHRGDLVFDEICEFVSALRKVLAFSRLLGLSEYAAYSRYGFLDLLHLCVQHRPQPTVRNSPLPESNLSQK
mmetsp:Transcript_55683/g.132773  ORF Transcript_55683/g.132773 Transcript_55683/m.132773 type:complete len:232 (+) Transcript_55683:167-862(+)